MQISVVNPSSDCVFVVVIVSVSSSTPPAPKNLRQTSIGMTGVHVNWDPIPIGGFSGALAGYQIVYNEQQKPNEKKFINNIQVC